MMNSNVITYFFYILPSINLLNQEEKIGNVIVRNKALKSNESPKTQEFLSRAFSLFKDPFGNELEYGIYITNEEPPIVEDIWSLLRFASYTPTKSDEFLVSKRNPDFLDLYTFYTPQHQGEEEKRYEIFSVTKNGVELCQSFRKTRFFPSLPRLDESYSNLTIPMDGLDLSKRLAGLYFSTLDFDIETIKLSERLRKAVYWYNKSYEQNFQERNLARSHFWNLESQLLFMAIAFETLFQSPQNNIQEHLLTSLRVIFPDNEFVPKWLKQFYQSRSAIAHGSNLERNLLNFQPDKGEHYSLIYWSRKIFRACVEAIISQWETSRNSGLLKQMTPNRIRLNRILGKLNKASMNELPRKMPDDIKTDIKDLHASSIDIPAEEYLVQTVNISNILAKIAVEASNLENEELRVIFQEFLSLPKDWYESYELRKKARNIFSSVLEAFGDHSSFIEPPIKLTSKNDLDNTLYYWVRFANMHVESIDW